MFRSMTALAAILTASSAFAADGVALKTRLIQSQMVLTADKQVEDGVESDVDNARRTIPGTGVGLGLEFALSDRARLGTELSYTEYERDDAKAFDTGLGGYFAYDLIKQDTFSLYGKGGLTAHQFGSPWYKTATFVNADVGVGATVAASESVDLGAEYLYSQTLIKGELKDKEFAGDKFKGVGQTRNDYSVFVAYKF